jgi:peptidoglycan/LPS O-acetylase OafA/YrhL
VRAAMRLAFHTSVRDLEIFPAAADAIAIGSAFALQRDVLHSNKFYARISVASFAPLLVMAAFLVERFSDYTIVDLLLGPAKLLAIATLVEGSTRFIGAGKAILNWRPIAWIGTLSYSLYLWQQPFLNRTSHLSWNHFPANLGLAVAAAVMSLYLVEKPILRFNRYFRRTAAGDASD